MKKIIILSFLFALLLSACEKTPLLEDVKIITGTSQFMHTSLSITLLNAKTGSLMGADGKMVKATITGPDAKDVFDITGQELEKEIKLTNGMVVFGIYSAREATSENPLRFNIKLEADGYLETSLPMVIDGKGRYNETINMIDLENTPEGVSYSNMNVPANNGIITETYTLESDEVEGTNTKAKLKMPEGMRILDKNGNPLGNALNVEMTYFNNRPETMMSYPGGVLADVEGNGDESSIEFFSAGFVAINITDGSNRKARFFESGALEVEVEIDPNTYNPETGATIQDGDIIPTWSFEVEDGIWTKEADVLITQNEEGKFVSTAHFEHLSYWNWDWPGAFCYIGMDLCFQSDYYPIGTPVSFRLVVRRGVDNVIRKIRDYNLNIGECITLRRAPVDQLALLTVIHSSTCGSDSQEYELWGACEGQEDIYINPSAPTTELTLHVDGYCPDSDILIRPTFPFKFKNLDCGGYWQDGMFEDGVATIHVVEGQRYLFMIYYDGRWIEYEAVIHSDADIVCENIPFSSEICSFFN